MCIRVYILNFKTKQNNNNNNKNNKKSKKTKKVKESKEEKRISAESLTGYDDIVCQFTLCTFNLLDRVVNFSWFFI